MDRDDEKESCNIKNGKSIIGSIGAYQDKFGGSEKEIRKLPYVYFIIKHLDAPSIDYSKKGKSNGNGKHKKNDGFGTPIGNLPKDIQNQIRY